MAADLYLLASEAPGVLDDWTGPVDSGFRHDGRWFRCVSVHWSAPGGDYYLDQDDGEEWKPSARRELRLDLRLPEVRDRLVRWGMEHDRRWGAAHESRTEYGPAWYATGPDPKMQWVGADDDEASCLEEARLWKVDWWAALRDSPSALLAEVREVAATLRE